MSVININFYTQKQKRSEQRMQNRHIYLENWQKQVYDIKMLETIPLAHIMMIGR